ncbi:MAG: hypothetical protein WB402_06555, partial [Sulfuricaulis sp.]
MNRFTTKLLVASVATAVSCAAMAAEKVPTLGEVLKASDIAVSGYIDTSYTNFDTDVPLYQAY